jgi:fructosamine-3-kinase
VTHREPEPLQGEGRAPSSPLAAARALLGVEILSARPLAGGQMEQTLALRLADGRTVVAKGGPAPRTEATMLQALRDAGVPAPEVIAVDDAVLVLTYVPSDGGPEGAWADLGTTLRRLHGASGTAYGWPEPYAFGRLGIANSPSLHWPTFWAERRLLAYADRLPPALSRRVEALASDLGGRLPSRPTPSLLHGDLWGGNILAQASRVAALVDPACGYGHAEADLAMLTLFDRPSAAFWEAYGPLEGGAAERRPVYALWHAIVHVAIFGAGYHGLVARLLDEARA